MFCRKRRHKMIQRIRHKTLKVVYGYDTTYNELFQVKKQPFIHQRHPSTLTYEVFKSISNFNLEFMWSYFTFKNITYNIRKGRP